jgi:hypothetical protein
MAHYFVRKPTGESKLSKVYFIYKKSLEPTEFILYAALPFIMICLGSEQTARIVSFFLLFWVIAQEVAFEGKMSLKKSLLLKIPLSILGIIILIVTLTNSTFFNYKLTFVLYTVIYELLTFIVILPDFIADVRNRLASVKPGDKSSKTVIKVIAKGNGTLIVHVYFIICIVTTLLLIN